MFCYPTRLLKTASGFYDAGADVTLGHPELEEKRSLYVKCLVQLLCKCSKLKDANLPALKLAVSNLLTQIETVVASGTPSACSRHYFLYFVITYSIYSISAITQMYL